MPHTPSVEVSTSSEPQLPKDTSLLHFVRLLPPDSFPELPPAVLATLQARRCQIPQAGRGDGGTNVITGAFTAKEKVEWAVLCSVNDSSKILVLSSVTAVVVDSVAHSADADWIKRTVSDTWTYSQVIGATPVDFLTTYYGSFPKPIDHNGISRQHDVLYSSHGRWYVQATSD